jgi:IMP dehydrogenase
MDTVTETDMIVAMSSAGGLGIVHRYNSISEQSKIIQKAHTLGVKNIGAAVGVTGDYLDRAKAAFMAGANVLCVDIAHGHHSLMKNALKNLRSLFDNADVHIIAGNVATLEAFNDLADWGADSVRVGVGGGSICSTRIKTGHGVPTLQSVLDCAKSDRDAFLIADGGVKNSGDIAKSIAAGADFVMIGSLLAGTEETPVKKSWDQSKDAWVYPYRGMASVETQMSWRGHVSSVEGVSSTVPDKGAVKNILADLERGLRSGMSYSGSRTIKDFQAKSKFIVQTSSGQIESTPHINRG